MPATTFGRSQIFCRPNQVREAAILISCLPKDGFVPLVVLSPPPCSEAEHREIYAQAVQAQRRSMEDIGSMTARHEVLTGPPRKQIEVLERIRVHRALQSRLEPLRSWRLHNRLMARTLQKIACDQAIFLFPPGAEDLKFWAPEEVERDRRDSVVLPDIKRLYVLPRGPEHPDDGDVFYYDDPNEIVETMWGRLRNTPMPAGVDAPTDDLAGLFCGLRDALRIDAPLRIRAPSECRGIALPETGPSPEDAAAEAVIVEQIDDASHLLAVLYASDRKLPLICVPAPKLDDIDEALAEFDRGQIMSSGAVIDGMAKLDIDRPQLKLSDDEKIVPRSLLREFLERDDIDGALPPGLKDLFLSYLSQDRFGGLNKVRAAVSRHVPVEALRLVGDRALTAFTVGVPYGLVKKAGYDWGSKPIGHIVGDMSLLLLNELTQEPQKNSVNLLFDPGYFRTTETQDVFSVLTNHYSHPMLLEHEAASLGSLVLLADTLPVELIFFNTHGADDAIVLGDQPYESEVLVQWVWLPSNPIVFNNSCLSWVGVGRQFLRMGARGYIGTLWSVDAELAARFAKHVMSTIVSANQPCSKAISTFSDTSGGSLTYVYVGTANGGIAAQRDERALDLQRTFYDYTTMLTTSVTRLRGSGQLEGPIARTLLAQLDHFVSRIDEDRLSADELSDLRFRRLAVWGTVAKGFPDVSLDLREIRNVAAAHIDALKARFGAAGGTPEQRQSSRENLHFAYRLVADVFKNRGDGATALWAHNSSVELSKGNPDEREVVIYNYQEIAELLKWSGDWKGAIEAGEKARDLILEDHDEAALMRINGVLGQLAKRSLKLDDAVRYAREGFDVAVRLRDFREQVVFKADLAQALLLKQDFAGAQEAALEAQRIARGNQDERAATRAYGILGHCYLAQDKLAEAESSARLGLQSAMAINDHREVGSFIYDFVRIKTRQGRFREAFVDAMHGVQIFALIGDLATQAGIIVDAIDLSITLKDWRAFIEAGFAAMRCMVQLPSEMQGAFIRKFLQTLEQAVYLTDRDDAASGIGGLVGYLHSLTRGNNDKAAGQPEFALAALLFYLSWLSGEADEATQRATQLDGVSGSFFHLLDVSRKPLPKRAPAKVFVRRLRAMFYRAKAGLQGLFRRADRPPAATAPPSAGLPSR